MLEPALDADHPAIVALVNLAYRGRDGATQSWNVEAGVIAGERTTLALLREELAEKPHGRLMVRRGGDEIRACVWLEPMPDGSWHLGMLAVHPDLQTGGLGRWMLDAAEAHVKALGAGRVHLSVVNVREALIAWYERRGYRRTGEIVPYPYGDDRFGRPLRDDLSFVVLEKGLG
jgi:ribosomal protein S18 acetylase RimI-like enzyme